MEILDYVTREKLETTVCTLRETLRDYPESGTVLDRVICFKQKIIYVVMNTFHVLMVFSTLSSVTASSNVSSIHSRDI